MNWRAAILLGMVLAVAGLAAGIWIDARQAPQADELADFLELFDLADPERRGQVPVHELLDRELGRDFVQTQLEQMLESRRVSPDRDSPEAWRILRALAWLKRDERLYQEEVALLREVAESVERLRGPEHPEFAEALNALGLAQGHAGHLDAARESFQRAGDIFRATPDPEHSLNLMRNYLSWVAELQGELGLAESGYRRVLTWREVYLGREHRETAWTLQRLARVVAEQGRLAQAEGMLRRALAIREKTDGPGSEVIGEVLYGLGRIVAAQGRAADAAALLERSLAVRLALRPVDHPDVVATQEALAGLRVADEAG